MPFVLIQTGQGQHPLKVAVEDHQGADLGNNLAELENQKEVKHKLPRGITKYIFTFDAVVLEQALVRQLFSTAEEVVRKEISYLRKLSLFMSLLFE
jgi:hypothetical protein